MAQPKIWVKAAHARAQFSHEVWTDDGKLVTEHVFAPTDPATGEQVPMAMEITDGPDVRRALSETHPDDAKRPARIVQATAAEIRAARAARGDVDDDVSEPTPEVASAKGKGKKADKTE